MILFGDAEYISTGFEAVMEAEVNLFTFFDLFCGKGDCVQVSKVFRGAASNPECARGDGV
jgi:hypothetical protein